MKDASHSNSGLICEKWIAVEASRLFPNWILIAFLSIHRIYESAPWSLEAWSRPVENSPLASIRLAGTAGMGNGSTVNSNSVRTRNLLLQKLNMYNACSIWYNWFWEFNLNLNKKYVEMDKLFKDLASSEQLCSTQQHSVHSLEGEYILFAFSYVAVAFPNLLFFPMLVSYIETLYGRVIRERTPVWKNTYYAWAVGAQRY